MNTSEIFATLEALALPASDYVVVGGAAMCVRGLRDTDDIDLVVTAELFGSLLQAGWCAKVRPNGKPGLRSGNVEAYLDVNTATVQKSTSWLLEHSEPIRGVRFVDLETLQSWKRSYGRDRDLRDVAIIGSLRTSDPPQASLERSRDG
jgi:hypothetical protein